MLTFKLKKMEDKEKIYKHIYAYVHKNLIYR